MLSRLALSVALALGAAAPAAANDRVRHDLQVALDPATHWLAVTSETTVPPGEGPVEFLLGRTLRVTSASPAIVEVPPGEPATVSGANATTRAGADRVKRYRLTSRPADGRLRLTYEGTIDFGLETQEEEYARGFRETAGLVGPDGVYLSGSAYWYPWFGAGLVEFTLEAQGPDGWHLVSQGAGTSRDGEGRARWSSPDPMDEIYLVGGPLQVWRDEAGAIETLVYLHDDEPGLARKYLDATAQYLAMYQTLVGPYPYTKFALVENFWETGYGMPSFTLLGPSIIRFPFILASSYPHEILHNWWGNGVFVDYETGNWSEGLTSYLADHLVQEQRGRGDDYRRATLQKYRNYARTERDFPLAEFRSRESAATEAVGYGKVMMGVHMLRRHLGDESFRTLLRTFYAEHRGTRAGFRDLQRVAERIAGGSLARFFDDWITRAGAADLGLAVEGVEPRGDGFVVRGTLQQTQPEGPFLLDVPVAVQTARSTVRALVRLDGPSARFDIETPAEPLVVHVDPQFDVFRKLDARETPPAIGQLFGEPRVLVVLPADAPPDERDRWQAMARGWQSRSHQIEFALDREVSSLPADRGVWLFGRSNRFAAAVFRSDGAFRLDETTLVAGGETMPLAGHAFVLTARHPAAADKAVGWIVVDPPAAFDGLGRKLPHYGRYSYLGFEGDEPVNVLKGEWAAIDSPLRVDLRPEPARGTPLPPLALEPRRALAELPPPFSEKALMEHVTALASPAMRGRGLGSPELREAAEYIATQFAAIGLEPGGDAGTWFQAFDSPTSPDGTPKPLVNVVGVLRGTRPDWEGQSALLTAHYDHLGFGWPDPRQGDEGTLHPGADDNASGVSVLIELARALAAGERPPRSIVFVAFSGEEAGLLGSRHFVAHPTPFPLEQVIGVINLDTVGRLGDRRVQVLGAGTASEWPHIFRGASFVTGVDSTAIPGNGEASDQWAFIERGVPAIQIFSGPHDDYHRPGDTIDDIDAAGLVKVATLAREGIAYLAERSDPLTNTIAPASPAASPTAAGSAGGTGRRVSFGAVPDFAFGGPGVRLEGVTPGSPAEKAGMQAGDVVTKLAGREIASLREFSEVLRTLAAGDEVEVVFVRDGAERLLRLSVVAR